MFVYLITQPVHDFNNLWLLSAIIKKKTLSFIFLAMSLKSKMANCLITSCCISLWRYLSCFFIHMVILKSTLVLNFLNWSRFATFLLLQKPKLWRNKNCIFWRTVTDIWWLLNFPLPVVSCKLSSTLWFVSERSVMLL